MECDYKFGNKCYKYFDQVGVENTTYKIMAPAQSQDRQPGFEY